MRGADKHLHDAYGEIGNELQDIRGITEPTCRAVGSREIKGREAREAK